MVGKKIILDLVIIPNHVKTGFHETSLGRGVVSVGAILGPELFQSPRPAAPIRVYGIAKVEKKVRLLRAHGVHDGKGLVALSAIAAETKTDFSQIISPRRGNEARDGTRCSTADRPAIIISRTRVEAFEGDLDGVIGIFPDFE